MFTFSKILSFFFLLCVSAGAVAAAAPNIQVTITPETKNIAAGSSTHLKLRFLSPPNFHTYWKEPGDSGFPPSIEWQPTALASPAPPEQWIWPPAKTLNIAGIRSAVLDADASILIPIKISPNAKNGETISLTGTISWLECDDKSCLPQEKKFSLQLTVGEKNTAGNSAADTPAAALSWEPWTPARQRELLTTGRIVYVDFTARWCATCQLNKRVYTSEKLRQKFLSENVALLRADWTRKNPEISAELNRYNRAAIPFNIFLKQNSEPVLLPELLTEENVLAALEQITTNTPVKTTNSQHPQTSFLLTLALAFLGGFLLNLMPCVFPVLGIKILGFAQQSGESRRRIAAHGITFAAGVVLSFWILVALLLILRSGGTKLGWGFQLQEPLFVFALTVLLFVLALNMAGVFEIGERIAGTGDNLAAKPGLRGSFFSGVLATIAATPCAAPFLGVSIGAALTLPPLGAFAIFTSVALGMSAPYLLLAGAPRLARFLPRPGTWMLSLKQGLSFLLFGSVAWLIWVLSAQLENGLLNILFGLVLIAFSCWIYGRWTTPEKPRRTRILAAGTAIIIFITTCAWIIITIVNV